MDSCRGLARSQPRRRRKLFAPIPNLQKNGEGPCWRAPERVAKARCADPSVTFWVTSP